MRRSRGARLWGAALAVVMASGGLVVATGPAAQAGTSTVTVPYRCGLSGFGVTFDDLQPLQVKLAAPDAITTSDPIPVTFTLVTPPTIPPLALSNVVVNLSPTVSIQNHAGGPITSATGLGADSAPTNLPANANLPVGAPVGVSFSSAGFGGGDKIDVRPGPFTVSVVSGDGGIGGASMLCTPEPTSAAPIAAVVNVLGPPAGPPVASCVADTGNLDTGSCETNQAPNAAILAGVLSQSATAAPGNPNATTVEMGTVTTAGVSQPLSGALNPITVTDTRGGSFQWSLTGSMTNFTTGTYSMAASQASISPSCAASLAGSAPGASAGGANQSLGSTVTLCTGPGIPDYTSGTTGGVWTVSAPINLTVPAFQGAGDYVAILTVTLS